MGIKILSRAAAIAAVIGVTVTAASDARAQNTIQAGIMSTIANSGAYMAGTVDSAYVTAVFGNNAYIQDATGGIIAYYGSKSGNALYGLTVGAQVTDLAGGGFQFYSGHNQYEYASTGSSVPLTAMSTTPGDYTAIPASYYTTLTLATFDSPAAQGSAANAGYQDQLITIDNVSFGSAAGGTFAGGSYTVTDLSGSGIFYVSSSNPLIGSAIPSGTANISGVFVPFTTGGVVTSELQPTGTYDVVPAVAPEPSVNVLLGAGGVFGALWAARRARGIKARPRGCSF